MFHIASQILAHPERVYPSSAKGMHKISAFDDKFINIACSLVNYVLEESVEDEKKKPNLELDFECCQTAT